MSTLLKVIGALVVGVVAIAAGLFVLSLAAGLVKLLFWVAVLGAIGWVVIKALSMAGGAKPSAEKEPPALSEAKTEPSRTLTAPEKKGMSEAEAARLFEEAKRKNTNGASSE